MESVAVKINIIRVFLSVCAHLSGDHKLLMFFTPAYIRTNYSIQTHFHQTIQLALSVIIIHNVACQYKDLNLA